MNKKIWVGVIAFALSFNSLVNVNATLITYVQLVNENVIPPSQEKIVIRILQGYARKVASAYSIGKVVITSKPEGSQIILTPKYPPSFGMDSYEGFHALVNGFPVGYCKFVGNKNTARNVTECTSHELGEMLVDPNMIAKKPDGTWIEIADSFLANVYDGYLVADFRLPDGTYEWRATQ